MAKKEERLSPQARELVEGARAKYYTNPKKAIKYLQSVNPSELNLYDRQKIGREILARYNSLGDNNYSAESIQNAYGLLTTKDKKRVEEENRGGKYFEKFKIRKEEKAKIAKNLREARARRGGLTSEEIDVHSNKLETSDAKKDYFNAVLRKRGLLGKETQKNIHKKLGQLYEESGDNLNATSHYQATGEFREVPLKEIVKNGTTVGFEVDGFDSTFDGDEYSGTRRYRVVPAGIDAPGVFKIMAWGSFGKWGAMEEKEESVISGDVEKAKEKAYQLALEYAQENVDWRNKYAKREGLSKALLVDETKIVKNKKDLTSRVASVIAIAGVLSGLFFLSSNITGNAIANVSQSSSNVLGAVLLVVGLVAGFFWVKGK